MADYTTLAVKAVVIHQVPKKNHGDPKYSEIPTPLDAKIQAYLKKRITSTAASTHSCDAVIAEGTDSDVPGLVETYFAKPGTAELVTMSQQIAQHLHDIQNQRNPEGLVWVVDCTIENKNAVVILKLEREEGLGITDAIIDGKSTVNVEVSELVLAVKTRVYKAGIFTFDGTAIAVRVSDDQMGTGRIADFFMEEFLGCRRMEDPAHSTMRFLDVTEKYINKQVSDAVDRSRYHLGLISEFQSHRTQIKPKSFIESVFDSSSKAT